MIDSFIEFIVLLDNYLSAHPVFIMTLLGTGIFFTIYLGFPQIRFFRKAINVVRGKHDHGVGMGDASHFQALATALSGTVGTGNIAGVALAIHLGGPASLFWMLVTALIGMATKFVEVTLSHKYRVQMPDGTMAGGPMFYMSRRLNVHIGGREYPTGKILAIVFATSTIIGAFGTGCFPQVNSIATSMQDTFGLQNILVGGVLACVLGLVILGGIKRIVRVTEKLVPIMAVIYFASAIIVILYHWDNIIPSICSIFTDVFTGTAATGGFIGATTSYALSRGINRGLFSNEAGQGSAPIAHAAARCEDPAAEGLVALLEPFIDTVVICMLTGTMILSSGVWTQKFETQFQLADMLIMSGKTDNASDIRDALENGEGLYNGAILVDVGSISRRNVTTIHNRSIAEEVRFMQDGEPYSGYVMVRDGKPYLYSQKGKEIEVYGRSLVHSAQLTSQAFASSWFGGWGKYIVTFSLLLFAFSTTIAWSYYGDRAAAFLLGNNAVLPFRIIYILGFFIGSFTDTTIAWHVASIGIVLMAMPNLIGLLVLHKEIKNDMNDYARRFDAAQEDEDE